MTQNDERFAEISDEDWARLERAALQVREHAHVPYSNFPVGAALLTEDGEVVVGCNVENATIGATVCAERNAIGTAVASGQQRFVALAVVTDVDEPSAPCGICRQVLAEFCDDLPILMLNTSGTRRFTTLDELLPMRFSGRDFLP
ncbi:cytidine deaminase [Lujinxingia litoralis]|uniref:Cytidine deaminase n=1 Tax=Lujinxingia litoralis TaxID=2211119 RepID=A0A328CAD8_9DELT|nr:cytidine deaminase [Lujinxingia litoralis]RAL22207.1 cytidine deaminase [Lujinxingia litoralis]